MHKIMNSAEFEDRMTDLEKRLERASKLYHKCLGTVVQKFLEREDDQYNDVTQHCLDQKRRVDHLMKELQQYHS